MQKEQSKAAAVFYDNDDDNVNVQIESLQELLAKLSANTVNVTGSFFTCYTSKISGLIDSGASTTFVRTEEELSNPRKHKSELQTSEGNSSFTSHSGNARLKIADNDVFIPA